MSSLKIFDTKFVKWCLRSKIESNILPTEGKKFNADDRHAKHNLFCYTTRPNNSTSQQVSIYKKAATTSMLPSQQCGDNSARATVRIC